MHTPTIESERETTQRIELPDEQDVRLPDDVRARLASFHERVAPQLAQIAREIVLATAPAVEGLERDRFRDDVVEWMRSGLLGPHDNTFRAIRARVARRFLESSVLHGAVYIALLKLRAAYRRHVTALYVRDEAWHVLEAVDKLIDLELGVLGRYHEQRRDRRAHDRDRDRLAERLAAIRTLTAGLAHEVRNPLNSAKLQLEVLERRLRRELADERFSGPSELARGEIEKLSDLLDELLAFANPASLELGEHDIMVIARDVVEAHRAIAECRGITLAVTGPPSAFAELDVPKMRTILHHLIVNGIEAVERDGAIRMLVRAHPERILIEVADDGPGIPSEIRTRVCEPFFSTKSSCTGLGMSIVHSMVALHGGSLEIDSEPGSTAIAVSIPRRAR